MDIHAKGGQIEEALILLKQMRQDDITPDAFTYSIIINGLKLSNTNEENVSDALQNISEIIVEDECPLDEVLFNSILDLC